MDGKARWSLFLILLIGSFVLGGVAAAKGEMELYLFLVFPVLRADGPWGAGAVLMAIATFLVLVFNIFKPVAAEERARARGSAGGVVLIGPIPIVFGTDSRVALLALLAALATLAVLALLLLA